MRHERCIAPACWPISYGFVYIRRLGPRVKHVSGFMALVDSATAVVRNETRGCMGLGVAKRSAVVLFSPPLYIIDAELEVFLASISGRSGVYSHLYLHSLDLPGIVIPFNVRQRPPELCILTSLPPGRILAESWIRLLEWGKQQQHASPHPPKISTAIKFTRSWNPPLHFPLLSRRRPQPSGLTNAGILLRFLS